VPKEPCIRCGSRSHMAVGVILRVEGRPIVKYREHSVVSCAKMAEPIKMIFQIGMVSPRTCVLGGGAHWSHLVNTIITSMCGGDAAF